ncbi:MAG: hypothetical protein H6712_30335 [Myxococcales bacterium]|nr:hypothetical protein [Myxococcales bacterium]MCB9718187.1 hypothetical protein [Myxococcales bacterium]
MVTRWLGWSVIALGVSACARSNPQFDPEGADEGSSGSPKATTTGSADDEGTTSPSTETTSTTAPPDPDSSTGGSECLYERPPLLELHVMPPLPFEGCEAPLSLSAALGESLPGDAIGLWLCEGCPCTPDNGNLFAFTFPVPPPDGLPPCFQMDFQPFAGAGPCSVAAYAFSSGGVMRAAVSNLVDPDIPEPFGFVLDPTPFERCDAGCMPMPSGDYTIRALTADGVLPTGEPTMLPNTDQDYEVQSFRSGIDGDCSPVGRWTARPAP